MPRAVLDASAALEIVRKTPASPSLLETVAATDLILAPDLFCAEVANALWKYVHFESLPRDQASEMFRRSLHLVDSFIPTSELAQESLAAAATHGHPVYDMLYAILARRHGAAVVTNDRRLVRLLEQMSIEAISPG